FIDLTCLWQCSKITIHRFLDQIKPDIVHGIGTEHPFAYVAISSRFPSVITVHGVMSEVVKKVSVGLLSPKRAYSSLEKYVLKRAQHIISISPYVKTSLGKYARDAKFYDIENCIDEVFFDMSYSANNIQKPAVLFIGMLQPRKGVLELAQAFKIVNEKHSDVSLKIVGPVLPGEEEYYSNLMSYIKDNKLTNNVEFLGYRDAISTAKELSKANMLVLSSREETAPMVISEAMAVGIPVIATKVGGVPSMIRDGETGFLVDIGDIEGLAQRMSLLLEDETLRKEMGRKAREEARRRFHPNVIAEKTREVYQRILEQRK
ncbi:MAG: glycosyltransferase family 4 protein, partial [Actinobacteria bacterium]|nr:glycosyltransferase family 4 protein [Actinomycetota bacterium]